MDGGDDYSVLGQDASSCVAASTSACAPAAVAVGTISPVVATLMAATDAPTVSGLAALQTFWQAAMPLNPNLPTDFPTFLSQLEQSLITTSSGATQDKVFTIDVQGIGNEIQVGGTPGYFDSGTVPMTTAQVTTAMQALATQGSGALPTTMNAFTAVLTNSATTVNFLAAMTYTAEASGGQVVQAAETAGNAIISTATTALAWQNYIIWGAVAFAAFLLYIKFGGKLSKSSAPEMKTNPKRSGKGKKGSRTVKMTATQS